MMHILLVAYLMHPQLGAEFYAQFDGVKPCNFLRKRDGVVCQVRSGPVQGQKDRPARGGPDGDRGRPH
jgi:hypothetical protein